MKASFTETDVLRRSTASRVEAIVTRGSPQGNGMRDLIHRASSLLTIEMGIGSIGDREDETPQISKIVQMIFA